MPVQLFPDARIYTRAFSPNVAPLSALRRASSTRLGFVEALSGPMDVSSQEVQEGRIALCRTTSHRQHDSYH